MLSTTNQTVTQWGQVFGDEMIAAAVLDRLLHHSHVVLIQWESASGRRSVPDSSATSERSSA
jgi:DNA replication protein DnaC